RYDLRQRSVSRARDSYRQGTQYRRQVRRRDSTPIERRRGGPVASAASVVTNSRSYPGASRLSRSPRQRWLIALRRDGERIRWIPLKSLDIEKGLNQSTVVDLGQREHRAWRIPLQRSKVWQSESVRSLWTRQFP